MFAQSDDGLQLSLVPLWVLEQWQVNVNSQTLCNVVQHDLARVEILALVSLHVQAKVEFDTIVQIQDVPKASAKLMSPQAADELHKTFGAIVHRPLSKRASTLTVRPGENRLLGHSSAFGAD